MFTLFSGVWLRSGVEIFGGSSYYVHLVGVTRRYYLTMFIWICMLLH